MRKTVITIGLISALAATLLSVSKYFNFSVLPIILAFISGLILIFLSKKAQSKIKPVQYIFLLVIISLSVTIFKSVFSTTSEIETIEQLEHTSQDNLDTTKESIDHIEVGKEK